MSKLKKVLLIGTAYALVAALAIGGTLAYMTMDAGDENNVFSIGNVNVSLSEDVAIFGEGGEVKKTDNGAEYTGIMPGDYLKKEVTVTNNGETPAYVAVTVKLNNADKINAAIDDVYENAPYNYTAEQVQAVYNHIFDGWGINYNPRPGAYGVNDSRGVIDGTYGLPEHVLTVDFAKTVKGSTVISVGNWFTAGKEKPGQYWVDGPAAYDGYYTKNMNDYEICYTYYLYLPAGESSTLFNGLNVPAAFNNEQIKMFDDLKIDVEAKAIQADNMGVAAQYKNDPNGKAKTAFAILAGDLNAEDAISTNNGNAPDVWDGTADTTWYNDTDTTFTLSTAEELAGFAKLANEGNTFSKKTIELESNVDLNGNQWTPLKKFAGTLNGNDHTISNFSVDATTGHGGFIDVMEWGTIEDLTLTDITATVGDYRFGALARSINQSNIDNVTIKNVNVTTTASTAFIAGLFSHGTVNSNMEVNNCTVENLTVNAEAGAYLIGGITTFVQKNGTEADGTNIFENLNVKNFKVIVNDTDGVCRVGGLVGQTQSVWQNPRFNNCTVTGLDITATGKVDVGGFICYPGSYTYAENCTTEGKIDVSGVTSADNFAGGFFGNYGWGDNVGKGDHKVTSCSADVDITTKYASAGGFVGSGTNYEGLNRNITLTNCKAKGTVTLVDGGTANIGGFAGNTDRGIYINCSAAQEPFIGKVLDGYTLNEDGNGTLTVTK